jgi:(1->4)-alpha-D-glucan 1-alpha-D-glucosylmutase
MSISPTNITSKRPPRATYRVQLNREFKFVDAARIVPYLARLGISHLYTSPVLKARSGSTHGYDVVDHTVLNPEIGTQEEFDELVDTLHAHQMGLIVDIVPNHLGIMGCDNEWWLDLLENGPAAQSASNFDIDWRPNRASLRNRVLVPILGGSLGSVLERGELKVEFDPTRGSFLVRYFDHCFPIDPREYPQIFAGAFSEDDPELPPDNPDRADFESLLTTFANLPPRDDDSADSRGVRYRDKEAHKRRLVRLIERSPAVLAKIEEAVNRINGTVGDPRSFDQLDHLLDSQAYRLAYWRVAVDEINYRRFFDVNDLAALRMNEPIVFEQTHAFIFKLIEAGKIDGLRIDHSDGLFDPHEYFEQLQGHFGAQPGEKPLYVVTEKILAAHERLPTSWAVHGTTGYDFVALVNGWLVNADHEEALTKLYRQFTGVNDPFDELAYQAKKLVMRTSLAAEVEVLATQLDRIAQQDRHTSDFTRAAMRDAIVETIARFPVYRTYVSKRGVADEDRRIVTWAINVARSNSGGGELSIYDFLRDVLLGDAAADRPEAQRRAMLEFAMKFQQVTAPVTAKGIEDTAFYRYHRLISANEVGGDPNRIAFSNAAVHQENLERARTWPHSMLASSTHDTKRSEDARARIAVLSELPELWRRHVLRWSRFNRSKRRQMENGSAPSRNDEYLIYQTLLGVWTPEESAETLVPRLQAYLVKATREAKRATSWMTPNADYEDGTTTFAARLLENPEQNAFLRDFTTFAEIVRYFGHLNSVAQTVLKLTSPGVPDTYQGTEVVALALVDPDNRRPVDYEANARTLGEIENITGADDSAVALAAAFGTPQANTAKLFVTWRLLQLRRELAEVFAQGDYEPLSVSGAAKEHVLAFSRSSGNSSVIVILAKWMAQLMKAERALPVAQVWGDTAIALSRNQGSMRDVFTNMSIAAGEDNQLLASEVFKSLPVAVLVSEKAP